MVRQPSKAQLKFDEIASNVTCDRGKHGCQLGIKIERKNGGPAKEVPRKKEKEKKIKKSFYFLFYFFMQDKERGKEKTKQRKKEKKKIRRKIHFLLSYFLRFTKSFRGENKDKGKRPERFDSDNSPYVEGSVGTFSRPILNFYLI